ncbi:hypothetical protein [Gloeobacter kilaueensis]|nr:hypothetical protein [Gloeobacter kilaueensis]
MTVHTVSHNVQGFWQRLEQWWETSRQKSERERLRIEQETKDLPYLVRRCVEREYYGKH